MNFIVDTSVWSLALRRRSPNNQSNLHPHAIFLQDLIESGQNIFLLGIILQEILQGISQIEQFNSLKKLLQIYPLIENTRQDYEEAAKLWNLCRKKGIQASTIDFLIAATTINHHCRLLTADEDFERIAKHSQLKLVSSVNDASISRLD